MPIQNFPFVWHNGRLIPWEHANLHVSAHAIQYGSAVFDGFRSYRRPGGTAAFRVADHMERLLDSARIYDLPVPFSLSELCAGIEQTLSANRIEDAYLRPVALRGYGESGLVPTNYPVEVYILAWRMGAHLGAEAVEEGADVCVASWARLAPNTTPALAKAAGNYLNSLLIRTEAMRNGYAEGIGLNADGTVSEGSGENVFVVYRDRLYTPPLASSILRGITRDTVLTLAADLGIPVREESIPREFLYCAHEVFFCGSAVEITPVRSVDRRPIRDGKPGPVTRRLRDEFFGIVRGDKEDRHGWLTVMQTPAASHKEAS